MMPEFQKCQLMYFYTVGNLELHHNGYSFYEFIAQQQLLGIFWEWF